MGEAHNMFANVNDQQQFRLHKKNEIKDYRIAEIKDRVMRNKRLSQYIGAFDYFDKNLIDLSATSANISVASFATVIGADVGIASESFSFAISITRGIANKLLKTTRNKKKKHNQTVVSARSKINNLESMISKALIDNKISQEGFSMIINKEKAMVN